MFKLLLVASLCAVAVFGQDQIAETLNFTLNNDPDGSYQFQYETSNGILGKEEGVGGVRAEGERQWIADDGNTYKFTYIADENGFQPSGDHLPQQPPYVARLIEWLEAHPSDDDGSYKPQ